MSTAMPPENYFMNWLKERIERKEIDIEYEYYERNKFVADFITPEKVKKWENTNPVFISAQTGAGKTTFIQQVLLRIVSDYNDSVKNEKQKKRILIISNRIALNRQIKKDIAEAVLDIVGDEEGKKQLSYYTAEGIDKLTEFGPVSVFPYQKINDSVFDNKNFQYVVCDEFHFFTSDASFNANTNTILQTIVGKGQDAVRIYISATPEEVFEAVVREEFCSINLPGKKFLFNILNKKKISKKNMQKIIPLHVLYYDMKRQYDYIDIDIVDWDIKSLVKNIKDSNKWLVFTSTKSDGEDIENEINKDQDLKGKKAVFISSANKSNGKAKVQYDQIIDNQQFDCDYLICTSVLDNGVSIKSKLIKGIILYKIFDRVEMLQMVGRIRHDETDKNKIKVYVILPNIGKRYIEKLKQLYATLIPEFATNAEKEDLNILNSKVKRLVGGEYKNLYYKKTGMKYYDYNELAVLQIISQLMMLKRFHKKYEPISENIRAFRRNLYKYCLAEGAEKSWSRNIYDIIESDKEREIRKKETEAKKKNYNWNQIDEMYSYIYERNDRFYNYIFLDCILEFLFEKFWEDVLCRLNKKEQRELNNRFDNMVNTNASRFETFKVLATTATDMIHENELAINEERINKYIKTAEYYHDLGMDENYDTVEKEIYRWFELPVPPPEASASIEHSTDNQDITEDYFEKYVLTDERFIENDPEWDYVEAHALKKDNIIDRKVKPIKRELTKDFSRLLELQNKGPVKIKDIQRKMPITINETRYIADSYTAPKDNAHQNYYFFISLDDKWRPYRERRKLELKETKSSPK